MITTHEQQLSSTSLSHREASGGVAANYFDRRHHQLPSDWPSAVSRFLDHGPARRQPKPNDASRPMPRRDAARSGCHHVAILHRVASAEFSMPTMASHADQHRHGCQVENPQATARDGLLAMAASRPPDRRVLSVRLTIKQIERLKRVCRDGAGKPLYLTLAGLVENALCTELDRVEKILDQSIVDPDDPTPTVRRVKPITGRMQRINNSPVRSSLE